MRRTSRPVRGPLSNCFGSSELILPEAGFYREAEEMKPQAVNTALLSEISRVTEAVYTLPWTSY